MPIAVMFPGQGAQRPGMGTRWRTTPGWAVVRRAEDVLDRPLADLLVDPSATFERTEDAQLGVLLTSLVAWESASPALGQPLAFAGHSLGQLSALIAAGVVSLDDGLRLAAQRARHTQEAAERRPGAMAALLGATLEQAEQACAAAPGACWVANDNAPGQVVIAGTPEGVERGVERGAELGVRRASRLAVGGAFHTPLMDDARAAFAADLAGVAFSSPAVPVVSNGDAAAHTDAEPWRARLADHLVQPVRWRESLETLVALGATELVEVGPGTTLAGLARRSVPGAGVRTVENPDSILLEVPA